MGKSRNKNAGSAFEYRTVKWFEDRPEWFSLRIPLSGASASITASIGGHDVKAWSEKYNVHLIIECKKRTHVQDPKRRDSIEIKKEWIDKLNFDKDEILVVATDRSDLYVFIPTSRFFQILGRTYTVEYTKDNTFSGDTQFIFKREYVDDAITKRYHLKWLNKEWIALTLADFVTLRETAHIEDELTLEDQLKRINTIEKLQEFETQHLSAMSYGQKKLLYQKFEILESGGRMNPIAHADSQFWMGSEAFIMSCPFCKKQIYKRDIDEKACHTKAT